jgi:hypothetical protein
MTTMLNRPAPGGPDLSARPDELTTRLTYNEAVFATRTAPLVDALAVLRYVIAVEMLARLSHAALTISGSSYSTFHRRLHSGEYGHHPVGHPRPGSLPQPVSALFLHSRCPKVYTSVPWWFGFVVTDLYSNEEHCADLLVAAREEGLTYSSGYMPEPLTVAELGPDADPEKARQRLSEASAQTLAETAVLLPEPLGLPQLRRRWHQHPEQEAALAQAMDEQAARAERLLTAIEAAVLIVAEKAVRRQQSCYHFLYRELAPHLRAQPRFAELLDNTPVAEDYAGLFHVLGMFKAITSALALPVRIRDALTTHPCGGEQAFKHWHDRAEIEGLPSKWTPLCVQYIHSAISS